MGNLGNTELEWEMYILPYTCIHTTFVPVEVDKDFAASQWTWADIQHIQLVPGIMGTQLLRTEKIYFD